MGTSGTRWFFPQEKVGLGLGDVPLKEAMIRVGLVGRAARLCVPPWMPDWHQHNP